MPLTDRSDLFASLHEDGINRMVQQFMRQRPSLFNYATEAFQDKKLFSQLCAPIKADQAVERAGNPLFEEMPLLPVLGSNYRRAPEVIRHELETSRRIIERETGTPCTHFCYPNGSPGDFSDASEEILRSCGFRSSLTTVGGLNSIPCSPFLLRRLGMTNDLRASQFEQYLAVGSASMTGIFGGQRHEKAQPVSHPNPS